MEDFPKKLTSNNDNACKKNVKPFTLKHVLHPRNILKDFFLVRKVMNIDYNQLLYILIQVEYFI